MIKLDASTSNTVVIVCDACPFWSAIRYGMEQAHECAEHHESVSHPGEQRARQTARKWRQSHGLTRR